MQVLPLNFKLIPLRSTNFFSSTLNELAIANLIFISFLVCKFYIYSYKITLF